jgi:hypothetical protein
MTESARRNPGVGDALVINLLSGFDQTTWSAAKRFRIETLKMRRKSGSHRWREIMRFRKYGGDIIASPALCERA